MYQVVIRCLNIFVQYLQKDNVKNYILESLLLHISMNIIKTITY